MNLSNLVERWQLVQAINADSELSASAKIVAVSLMGFVNSKTGECFPSFEKIAASCHVSKRTVATATYDLERRKWVKIVRDEGGDRESNRYFFAFDRIRVNVQEACDEGMAAEFHGEKFSPCLEGHGAKSALSMVKNSSVHGAKTAPKLEEDNSFKGTQEPLSPNVDEALPEAGGGRLRPGTLFSPPLRCCTVLASGWRSCFFPATDESNQRQARGVLCDKVLSSARSREYIRLMAVSSPI